MSRNVTQVISPLAAYLSKSFCFGEPPHHSVHISYCRFNDSDHLKDPDLYSDKSDREGEQDHEESDPEGLEKSEESDSDTSERQDDSYIDLDPNEHLRETLYLEQSHEELGEVGHGEFAASLLLENMIASLGHGLIGFLATITVLNHNFS